MEGDEHDEGPLVPHDFWKATAEPVLSLARAVRDGQEAAPADLPVPPGAPDDDTDCRAVRTALGYVADELSVVRAGRAASPWAAPWVLADEIKSLEAAVARL